MSPEDYGDFTNVDLPDQNALSALSSHVLRMVEAENHLKEISDVMKDAQEDLKQIVEHDIPDAMSEAGVSNVTTSEGFQVTLVEKIRHSIPAAKKASAMSWLDDHGHGGLIKRQIEIAFNREQEEEATGLLSELGGRFLNVRQNRKVEASTMAAFIREQLEDGADFPMELFGAWKQRFAKVKRPKKG